MKAVVLGRRPVKLTNKDTGETISGVSLYCSFRDPNVVGQMVDKFFINDNLGYRTLIDGIAPGTKVNLDMYKSKVMEITILPDPADGKK